ncbi:MAG: hypothetical protein GWP19_11665 [Planctomycetia bacterium]|nr:hypothetical protein [Planctomycetia bacterium]
MISLNGIYQNLLRKWGNIMISVKSQQ